MLPKPCSQFAKHVEKAIYQWTGFYVVRISIAKTFVMAVHNETLFNNINIFRETSILDVQEKFAYFVKSKRIVVTFSFKCVIPSRKNRCFLLKRKVR